MTCCPQCRNKDSCPNSTVFNPIMKDDNTTKKARAIAELASRLNLPLEFVFDNLEPISEILTTFKLKEYVYP